MRVVAGKSYTQLRSVELLFHSLSGGFRRLTMQSYDTRKWRFTISNFLRKVKIAESPVRIWGVEG